MDLDGVSRQEISATLPFLAADTPRVIYGLNLMKDGRPVKLDIRPDGSLQAAPSVLSNALAAAADDPFFPQPAIQQREIPIPAEAGGAVESVKREYPGARDMAIIAPDGTRNIPPRPWHCRGRRRHQEFRAFRRSSGRPASRPGRPSRTWSSAAGGVPRRPGRRNGRGRRACGRRCRSSTRRCRFSDRAR